MSDAYDVVCSSEDRARWLDLRSTGIGASEIAAVLGESRWKSPLALYAEKTGESSESSDNEAMFWGLRLERIVADVFSERTGRAVMWSGEMLRSREHPWALATLDALVAPSKDVRWPLDSKTSSAFKADDWEDGPPREYYLQLQQQMLVTGASRASIACLLGGQRLVWCDVERDEIEIRRIIHAGRAFWERVEQRSAPFPDGSDSSRAALLDLYPHAEDTAVSLALDFEDLYDELAALKAFEKRAEARRAEIENLFKSALGNSATGLLPSGRRVSWREQQGRVDYRKCAESLGATHELLEKNRSKSTRVFRMHDAKES